MRSPRLSALSTRRSVSSELFRPASSRLMLGSEVPASCANRAWVRLRLRRTLASRVPRSRMVISTFPALGIASNSY